MLEDIKKDIQRLIALYEKEYKLRVDLENKLSEVTAMNKTYREKITELETEIDNLQLTKAFMASGHNKDEAAKKIDKLIREIDKCINLLNN